LAVCKYILKEEKKLYLIF